MAWLYLIRHPLTAQDAAQPASSWDVSDAGHEQILALVAAPFWRQVKAVYTSPQRKTTLVGDAVQAAHRIPYSVVADLAEARRDVWLGPDAFQAAQRAFLAQPAVPPVPEWESAADARARFVAAMDQIGDAHDPAESLAVVTHGTVLTLYVAHLLGEPLDVARWYAYWRGIGFATVLPVARDTLRPVGPFVPAPYTDLPV